MGLLAGLAGLVSQVGLPNLKKIKNVKVSKMDCRAPLRLEFNSKAHVESPSTSWRRCVDQETILCYVSHERHLLTQFKNKKQSEAKSKRMHTTTFELVGHMVVIFLSKKEVTVFTLG